MPIQISVEELDEDGDDDAWHEAGRSTDLPPSVKIVKIKVGVGDFSDQGWGNTKGGLALSLWKDDELVERVNLFGTYRTQEYNELYGTDSPERTLNAEGIDSQIIQRAAPGMHYRLEFCVGGGGGHELHVHGLLCQIFSSGESEDEEEDPNLALIRARSVAIGKMTAGCVRFFFEDVLSGSCQLIYLCKKWNHITLGSKVFTLMSIASGVSLSLVGPLLEFRKAQKMKQQVLEHGGFEALRLSEKKADQAHIEEGQSRQPLLEDAGESRKPEQQFAVESSSSAPSEKKKDEKVNENTNPESVDIGITVVPDLKIADIIRGKKSASQHAGLLTLFGSLAFWLTMSILPFIVDVECGENVPGVAILVFFITSMTLSLMEVWVTIQCRIGYLMFKHLSPQYILGYFLSHIGRFDTFSDVYFAKMIRTCEPITWFSIKGKVFHLPFGWNLADTVLVIFIIGVLLFQALPGVVMLACKDRKYLPIACKMNEFNLLLAVMETEASLSEHADEQESITARSAVMKAAYNLGMSHEAAGAMANSAANFAVMPV